MSTQPTQPSFWSRQFQLPRTAKQKDFDLLFGIIAPILCLLGDPIVFRDLISNQSGLLENYKIFNYSAIGSSLFFLSLYFIMKIRGSLWNSSIGMALFIGAIGALIIGLILLPFSLFGLGFGVGVFGFVPFFTAFTFFRNGLQIFQTISYRQTPTHIVGAILISSLVILGIPGITQWFTTQRVTQAVAMIIQQPATPSPSAIADLKGAFWCSAHCFDPIVMAYRSEENPDAQLNLANSYYAITGHTIKDRISILVN